MQSTLIPAFPSPPAASPSACRCCVFSPTYKILSRSWVQTGSHQRRTNKECTLALLLRQAHIAVEVCVCAGGVGVPQSDGVIGRAGEEGRWRQAGLRRLRQLRVHLNKVQRDPDYFKLLSAKPPVPLGLK